MSSKTKIIFLFQLLILLGCSPTTKQDSWLVESKLPPTCSIANAARAGMAVVFNTRFRNERLTGDPYLGWPLSNRKRTLEELYKYSTHVVELPDLGLQKVAINPLDDDDVVASYSKSAQEVGAKYLLLLHAAGGIKNSRNYFQILYLTIIGAFIFPGNEGEGQAILQALLYAPGSTKPCYVMETEGYSSQYRPYAFFDETSLYAKARDRAFKPFIENLK